MHKLVVHCKRAPYDEYIGRPGKWGNKFKIGNGITREQAVAMHRAWVLSQPELIKQIKQELRGKVLGCWCAPNACHGDTLAEIANA